MRSRFSAEPGGIGRSIDGGKLTMGRGQRSRRRHSGGVLETGLGLASLGIFMLLLPVFMNTPLQQSALEPLEPIGWTLLLLGLALCAWAFRPVSSGKAAGQSFDELLQGGPDSSRRGSRARRRERDLAREAARRAALQAAIDANIERIASGQQTAAEPVAEVVKTEFPDTVLAPPPASRGIVAAPAAVETPRQWSAQAFELMGAQRFEAVVQALFGQAGFKTRPQKDASEGGGAAIWLFSRHAQRAVSVVAYRHGQNEPVALAEVRRFHRLMRSRGLRRGTFATPAAFTPEARGYAAQRGIHVLDSEGLLQLIAQRTPEQQAELFDLAFEREAGLEPAE